MSRRRTWHKSQLHRLGPASLRCARESAEGAVADPFLEADAAPFTEELKSDTQLGDELDWTPVQSDMLVIC